MQQSVQKVSFTGNGLLSLKANVKLWCDRVTCLGFKEILYILAYDREEARFVCRAMGADARMLNNYWHSASDFNKAK